MSRVKRHIVTLRTDGRYVCRACAWSTASHIEATHHVVKHQQGVRTAA